MPRHELIERNHPPRKHRRMAMADVVRFESGDKYVSAHSLDASLVLTDTLTALAAEFPERFFRVHVSHLVDLDRIVKLYSKTNQPMFVQLHGVPELVPLGRRQLRKLLERRPDLARR
jgi:DNA-binding LytR/AlgR family response regulator